MDAHPRVRYQVKRETPKTTQQSCLAVFEVLPPPVRGRLGGKVPADGLQVQAEGFGNFWRRRIARMGYITTFGRRTRERWNARHDPAVRECLGRADGEMGMEERCV